LQAGDNSFPVERAKEVGAIRTNVRINEQITAREVRLIDDLGKQLGIVPVAQAIERAQSRGYDLVEVAPDASPPVCRIMDFTKYLYEQKRKQKLARKKTHKVEIKEIKLRPNINPHDFGIKLRHGREFLEKGHKLKITVRYRAREMRHYEIGSRVLREMVDALNEVAVVESTNRGAPGMRMQMMMLAPKKTAGAAKPAAAAEEPVEALETEGE
jgi:translation initiation factor IF-3